MRALVITNSITRRDTKAVDKYMTEVSHYELLTPEEEVSLFQRIRTGDEEAFQRIIQANLRFVISVAKQYQHCGLPLLDLISEGNLGLIKAARRFDETKGFKFISYAVWWIRQSILQAVGEKSRKIRVPLNRQATIMKVMKVRDQLHKRHEREPLLSEIAEELDLKVSEIRKSLEYIRQCRSLDAPVRQEEDLDLTHFLEDESVPSPDQKVVEEESLQEEVKYLLSTLNPREAQVISMYYGIGRPRALTLREISEHLDMGVENLRNIKNKSLRKLNRMAKRQIV